jgi:hypothetical protein
MVWSEAGEQAEAATCARPMHAKTYSADIRRDPLGRHQLFVERLLIVAVAALLMVLLVRLAGLVLVMLGAVVLAVALRQLALPAGRRLGIGERTALALVLLLLCALSIAVAALFGAQIGGQFSALGARLPEAVDDAAGELHPLDTELVSALREGAEGGSNILGRLSRLALTVGSPVGDLLLIIVGAIFFAARPRLYEQGFLKLFPHSWRPLIGESLADCGAALALAPRPARLDADRRAVDLGRARLGRNPVGVRARLHRGPARDNPLCRAHRLPRSGNPARLTHRPEGGPARRPRLSPRPAARGQCHPPSRRW